MAEPLGAMLVTLPFGGAPAPLTAETWKPAEVSARVASACDMPTTSGTWALLAPRTYLSSSGGSTGGGNSPATAFMAENQVRAGSLPPNRLPLPQLRSGKEQISLGVGLSP